MIEVTQADRDAALILWESEGCGFTMDETWPRAFARHRIASQEQAVRAAIEVAAYKATSFLVGNPKEGISLRSPSPHAIADAIRNLDPAQITKGLSDG